MKILVINAGSSSIKYQLFNMDTREVMTKGGIEKIGQKDSFLTISTPNKDKVTISKYLPTHNEAIQLVLEQLVSKENGVVSSMKDIDAVGHRVLHSGNDFEGSVIATEEVMKICEKNIELGPLHMPANLAGIRACQKVIDVPQVLVFDTAFHSTIPDYASRYAIPTEAYDKWKIKKYGFHGTSHKYISNEAAKFLKKDIKELKLITCHLGNGSSISAVQYGKCIDTSMGLTPLAGLPMGTRSGDIDPAVLQFIMNKTGMTIDEMLVYLNNKSGMKGLCGESDFRNITNLRDEEGNDNARLALDMFAYSCKKFIGAYYAAMNGVDAIVFTGGVGENVAHVRKAIVNELSCFGIELDEEANLKYAYGKCDGQHFLSTLTSKTKVLVIPTNEELMIAKETESLVKNK